MVNVILLFASDWIVELVYRGIFPDAAKVLRFFIVASFFEPFYMVSAKGSSRLMTAASA